MRSTDDDLLRCYAIIEDRATKIINFAGVLVGFLVVAITSSDIVDFSKTGFVGLPIVNIVELGLFLFSVYSLIMCIICGIMVSRGTAVLEICDDARVRRLLRKAARNLDISEGFFIIGLFFISGTIVFTAFKSWVPLVAFAFFLLFTIFILAASEIKEEIKEKLK